ncbi:uncharacterized protein BT62DRAFT_989758 [Guyanagaster necrorhizus]|uniref:Arrestin C-terminal-like domain-containing protein n=1 Tax=Guyanagaster necrorhizus TaxID=856835 RepID=A0A9P7W4R6_9AGAR|nr:uncharacterized protein BT62DRAFT_989758 [Guyanagaster necrorhizus MCA 3950]KAG7452653.1 hypothetical protein BT62DRAFT_989758 [Guyanagaster necrorhizus MCA 3950]
MVRLILGSTKGNGVRYFPYTGYLGLTPVKVDGAVLTRLDQDLKMLPARSITVSVRCYELVLGRVGVLQSNVLVDYTKVLWEKPEGQEYGEIGDLELPFRFSIPTKVGGLSTASFVEYRCLWRVEAILNHIPITVVGSRQVKHAELPLTRYDTPANFLPSHRRQQSTSVPLLDRQTSKPRAPRICYAIKTPSFPVGPMDLVSVHLYLLPNDASVSIRSASAIIERRIHINEASAPSTVPASYSNTSRPTSQANFEHHSPTLSPLSHSPISSYQDSHHNTHASTSSSSLSSSHPTITPNSVFPSTTTLSSAEKRPLLHVGSSSESASTSVPLIQSEMPHGRTSVHPVAGMESSGPFTRDQNGILTKTLTVPWPVPKSNSRWAVGETVITDFVSVKFFVRVKVVVTSPSGTESLELEERELFIVSTNDAERQLALANYESLQQAALRSKSKSPRRSRRTHDDLPGTPVPRPPSERSDGHTVSSGSSRQPTSHSAKGKAPIRRPHTSAGPRDMLAKFSVSRPPEREPVPSLEVFKRIKYYRPGTVDSGRSGGQYLYAPRMSVAPSGSSTSSGTSSMTSITSSSSSCRSLEEVREWEQELMRIEVQSRRSSDLIGFAYKRNRPSTSNARLLVVAGKS